MAYKLPPIIFQAEDYFVCYLSNPQGSVTGNGTVYPIICDGIIENKLGNYNSTTGVFTCSLTGLYALSMNMSLNNGAGGSPIYSVQAFFNGSVFSFCAYGDQLIANSVTVIFSKEVIIPMTVGDTMAITIKIDGIGANSFDIYGQTPQSGLGSYSLSTVFSGYKIY